MHQIRSRNFRIRISRTKARKPPAYHFGSQGTGNTFSNHTSHSNRLIPVYVFGRKADLGAVTGKNSCYRDPEKIRKLYGTLPANTLNPSADYCDQSDLYQVQTEAVKRGAKFMFTVWFDGMDWDTTGPPRSSKPERFTPRERAPGSSFRILTRLARCSSGFA